MNKNKPCMICEEEFKDQFEKTIKLENCEHIICETCLKKWQKETKPEFDIKSCPFCKPSTKINHFLMESPKEIEWTKLKRPPQKILKTLKMCLVHLENIENIICLENNCENRFLSCLKCFKLAHENCKPEFKIDVNSFSEIYVPFFSSNYMNLMKRDLISTIHKSFEKLAKISIKFTDQIFERLEKQETEIYGLNYEDFLNNKFLYDVVKSEKQTHLIICKKNKDINLKVMNGLFDFVMATKERLIESFSDFMCFFGMSFQKDFQKIKNDKTQDDMNFLYSIFEKFKKTKVLKPYIIFEDPNLKGSENEYNHQKKRSLKSKLVKTCSFLNTEDLNLIFFNKKMEKKREIKKNFDFLKNCPKILNFENKKPASRFPGVARTTGINFAPDTPLISQNVYENFSGRTLIPKVSLNEKKNNNEVMLENFSSCLVNLRAFWKDTLNKEELIEKAVEMKSQLSLIKKEFNGIQGLLQPEIKQGEVQNISCFEIGEILAKLQKEKLKKKSVLKKNFPKDDKKMEENFLKTVFWKGHSLIKVGKNLNAIQLGKNETHLRNECPCIFYNEEILNESLFEINLLGSNFGRSSFFGFLDGRNKDFIKSSNKYNWNNDTGSLYLNNNYVQFRFGEKESLVLEAGKEFELIKGDVLHLRFLPNVGVVFSVARWQRSFYFRFKSDDYKLYLFFCIQETEHVFEVKKLV